MNVLVGIVVREICDVRVRLEYSLWHAHFQLLPPFVFLTTTHHHHCRPAFLLRFRWLRHNFKLRGLASNPKGVVVIILIIRCISVLALWMQHFALILFIVLVLLFLDEVEVISERGLFWLK